MLFIVRVGTRGVTRPCLSRVGRRSLDDAHVTASVCERGAGVGLIGPTDPLVRRRHVRSLRARLLLSVGTLSLDVSWGRL